MRLVCRRVAEVHMEDGSQDGIPVIRIDFEENAARLREYLYGAE